MFTKRYRPGRAKTWGLIVVISIMATKRKRRQEIETLVRHPPFTFTTQWQAWLNYYK
jgi:hypothetical protein